MLILHSHYSFEIIVFLQIQSSGQCIEYFDRLQPDCAIKIPLHIPLPVRTWWGTAHKMLDCLSELEGVHPFNQFLITFLMSHSDGFSQSIYFSSLQINFLDQSPHCMVEGAQQNTYHGLHFGSAEMTGNEFAMFTTSWQHVFSDTYPKFDTH